MPVLLTIDARSISATK